MAFTCVSTKTEFVIVSFGIISIFGLSGELKG